MLKKLLILVFLGLILASAYLYWDYSQKREVITPYPYTFTPAFDKKYDENHAQELIQAENAKILIVGDRMAKTLDPYTKTLENAFAETLKTPPKIYNWGAENEGLFRTVHKLKKLKTLPPIIIYFGASSELMEKKFDVRDRKNILKNFQTYDDEKLISLIITFPWLSRALYKDIRYHDLGEFTEYKSLLASTEKLSEKDVSFKLFSYEMKEMIDYIKDKKSTLIIITTPINLEAEPKEVCAHSSNEDVIGLQQEIEAEIKDGQYKSAFPKAAELAEATFSNARSFYLLGKSALGAGDIKTAREALMRASAFDCQSWRGNSVYNAIMKDLAKKNLVSVVDFDQFMSSQLSKEGLFFDEIVPQTLFYQGMIEELSANLKRILSINERP